MHTRRNGESDDDFGAPLKTFDIPEMSDASQSEFRDSEVQSATKMEKNVGSFKDGSMLSGDEYLSAQKSTAQNAQSLLEKAGHLDSPFQDSSFGNGQKSS